MKKFFPETVLMFITLIWGATFVIIKSALNDISPFLFISIRFLFATIILLPFIFKIFKNFNRRIIWGGIILGLLYFIGFSTQTVGLKYTTATKSAFITGTFVIFIPIFQVLIEKRIPRRGVIFGIFLTLIGLLFLTSKGDSLLSVFTEISGNFNIGDFFTIVCAVFFALYVIYLDIISKKHDYKPLVFFQISVTGVCGILFAFLFTVFDVEEIKFNFNSDLLFAVLYTSILATVLATTLQTKYQKFVTPSVAGIIISFEPMYAAVFAFFVLNEKISNFGLIGCVLIFSGLLVSELLDKKKMDKDFTRAEIIINGLVQGVGFRYFVMRNANALGLKGFTKNLFSGEVLTVVEGSKPLIEELYKKIIIGPSHASVKNHNILWHEPKNEFYNFEIRH